MTASAARRLAILLVAVVITGCSASARPAAPSPPPTHATSSPILLPSTTTAPPTPPRWPTVRHRLAEALPSQSDLSLGWLPQPNSYGRGFAVHVTDPHCQAVVDILDANATPRSTTNTAFRKFALNLLPPVYALTVRASSYPRPQSPVLARTVSQAKSCRTMTGTGGDAAPLRLTDLTGKPKADYAVSARILSKAHPPFPVRYQCLVIAHGNLRVTVTLTGLRWKHTVEVEDAASHILAALEPS